MKKLKIKLKDFLTLIDDSREEIIIHGNSTEIYEGMNYIYNYDKFANADKFIEYMNKYGDYYIKEISIYEDNYSFLNIEIEKI